MIDQAQTDKLQEMLQGSKQSLLIFPESALVSDLDLFLAAYCFYRYLFLRSDARLLSPRFKDKLPQQLAALVETTKIETELGKENLLISFPYQEAQVDKVSYYIGEQDGRFYLTIKPKSGVAPLDSKQVEFAYAGTQADLLVLMGVEDLEKLEHLYFGYENLYKNDNTRIITFNSSAPDFGSLHLDVSNCSSYSELVFTILNELAAFEDQSDLVTLLLYGIEWKTQALQSDKVSKETFLVVAELLRLGAERLFKLENLPTKTTRKKNPMAMKLQEHSVK